MKLKRQVTVTVSETDPTELTIMVPRTGEQLTAKLTGQIRKPSDGASLWPTQDKDRPGDMERPKPDPIPPEDEFEEPTDHPE